MKKFLSMALCLAMILSLAVVASAAAPKVDEVGKVAAGYAPEGTGISSLAEATDPMGKYYLKADITVDASIPEFGGTLDGNGHTVTVSVPLFTKLAGTVKNLTLKGAVDTSATPVHVGALAAATENATVENVKNEASVKGYITKGTGVDVSDTKTDGYKPGAGGIVGRVQGDTTFTNCANTGAINGCCTGGIVGISDGEHKLTFKNCVNAGKITNEGITGNIGDGHGSIGGIIGCLNNTVEVVFDSCENNGEVVSSFKHATGGICGGAWRTYSKSRAEETAVTFKNCKNAATITGGWQTGGIAGWMRINTYFEGCVNTAKVLSTQSYSGGIVGRPGADRKDCTEQGADYNKVITMADTDKYITCTIDGCLNSGDVYSFTGEGGGIVGYSETALVIKNTTNTGYVGRVEGATAKLSCGGIIGIINSPAKLTNCTNTGKVDGQGNSGGIIGQVTQPDKDASSKGYTIYDQTEVIGCTNAGEVVSSAGHAAGFIGYQYGTGNYYAIVKNSLNTAKIAGVDYISQFVAYTNNTKTTIQNCLGTGSIAACAEVPAGKTPRLVFVGLSSANIADYQVSGNFLAEGHGMEMYSYADKEDHAANRLELTVAPTGTFTVATTAQLSSGEVAYKLNTAIGENVFRQTLGTDAAPNLDASNKVVVAEKDGYANEAAPVQPPKPTPTGDSTIAIFFALMAVSAGAVLTLKKKTR